MRWTREQLLVVLNLYHKLKSLLPSESVAYHFEVYEGKTLSLPTDGFPPNLSFLSSHRKKLARN